jgi:hypothetical protein
MDPNIKLVLDELVKLRTEMKEGFKSQEVAFTKRIDEVTANDCIYDTRVANLEESTAAFDSSMTAVKLELSKLNSFLDRDVRAPGSSSPSILHIESASVCPPAGVTTDGPVGHHSANDHRDCGYGRVYAHTHDPVKGTIPTPPSMSLLVPFESMPADSARFSPDSRVLLGKLPKMKFPTFDGENPKLWQSHCENYFEMYMVESSVWVHNATMHFQGPAVLWLQSINHRVRLPSWKELCSWLHDRFGHDQHDSLIRQLFHIRQVGSVQEYIDKFSELVDQLVAYEHCSDH